MAKRTKLQMALRDLVDFVRVDRWDWRLLLALFAVIVLMAAMVLVPLVIVGAFIHFGLGVDRDTTGAIVLVGLLVFLIGAYWWNSIECRQFHDREDRHERH